MISQMIRTSVFSGRTEFSVRTEDQPDDYHDPEFLKSNQARGQRVRLDEGDRKSISLKVIPSDSEEP
jgi:hypothetical protein